MSRANTLNRVAWNSEELTVVESCLNGEVGIAAALRKLPSRTEKALHSKLRAMREDAQGRGKGLAGDGHSKRAEFERGCTALLEALHRFYLNREKALEKPVRLRVENGKPLYALAVGQYQRIAMRRELNQQESAHMAQFQRLLEAEVSGEHTAEALAEMAEFAQLEPGLREALVRGELVQPRHKGCRILYSEILEFYRACAEEFGVVLTPDQLELVQLLKVKYTKQQYAANHRKRHPERVKAANKAYTAKNKDKAAARSARYKVKHRDRYLQQMRDYRARNPEKFKGRKHPIYERIHEITCSTCHQKVLVSQHSLDSAPAYGIFCSLRCQYKHPECRETVQSDCTECGESFSREVLPWKKTPPTCSDKCKRSRNNRLKRERNAAKNGLSPPESCDAEGLSSSCCEPENACKDPLETSGESISAPSA